MNKICLIGDIMVDVTLKNNDSDLKMRLGGIIHSARALWAISNKYGIGYLSPKYLDSRINNFVNSIGNPEIFKLAETLNAPNLILIQEPKEIGNQGYELILREDIEYEYYKYKVSKYDRILVTLGQFNILEILNNIDFSKCKVSLELANNSFQCLKSAKFNFENIYISTSCQIFKEYFDKNSSFTFEDFANQFKDFCNCLILKENRGGTRLFSFKENKKYQVSSQTKSIVHSVGVGDVFNAIFESEFYDDIQKNLTFASFIAMEYASTTYPVNFKESVERYLKKPIANLQNLKGTILNWEIRSKINIYLAAPDFDFVNTGPLDLLDESLKYHNFTPRRPIKENGQMSDNDSDQRKKEIYQNDLRILNECIIMIAVLLYNDPGTLVEIGIASERNIPVLLFDPYNIATNCMLTHSCKVISNSLDEIISEVYQISSKLCSN